MPINERRESREMQGISKKILKNHILFSHGTAWREEENAESVLKFCEEIGYWYLQTALAVNLQRKKKSVHREKINMTPNNLFTTRWRP